MTDTVSAMLSAQSWLPVLTLLAGLLAPTIAAVVGVWLANHNASRARAAAERVEGTLVTTSSRTNAKLDAIQRQTNGRLEEALRKIDALEQRLFEATGERVPLEPPSPTAD
jgi:hypothetical protein